MTTTPILVLDELASGQAIPETTVNENTRWLEFFSAGGAITDRDDTAPPGSPVDGEAYLIAATATGDWAGHDGEIALYISTAWEFKEPTEGMQLYVKDEDVRIIYDGANWDTPAGSSGGATEASASEIWTGTETGKYISPDKLFDSAAFQTLVDGATITPDFNAGLNFTVTLGGNRTLANPTNAKEGQSGVIEVVQDATGSRTLAYGANWRFPGGSATGGVLSTAANSIDVIAYIVKGSLIYATLSKAFAA